MVVTSNTDTMYANNKRTLRFTITDEDAGGSTPLDLTGYTAKWAISKEEGKTTPILEKATGGNGITVTDAANGELEVALDPEDTVSLKPQAYYMELEVFDGSNDGLVVATGTLTIKANIVNTL